jgi:Zn-dependent peptidase ImmA (M78 family)/transcriptional regulator with XRE-family HTH domain
VFYGERLRQLREMHSLTQAAFCEEAGTISQYQLSRIEKGQAFPSDPLTEQFAAMLGVAPEYLEREPGPILRAHTPQLRPRSRLTARAKHSALGWGRFVAEEHFRLQEWARPIPLAIPPDLSRDDPATSAADVRRWLGFTALDPLPYLVLAAERAGIVVVGLPLESEDLDVICAWYEDKPVIGLLTGAPGDRLRFSLAHELGHLVLHQAVALPNKTHEDEADAFATALLAPLDGVSLDLPARPTLSALSMVKTKWGVSIKFLVRRCKELGIIDQERMTGLYRQMSARGWNRNEPGHVPDEKPRAFRKMCEIAFGPGDVAGSLSKQAAWSESVTRSVLSRHARRDELPFETPNSTSSLHPNVVPLRTRR